MQKNEICTILMNYCAHFPILSEWGCTMKAPIGLIFEDINESTEFVREVSANADVFTVNSSTKALTEKVFTANSTGLFYQFPINTYAVKRLTEQLNLLTSASTLLSIDGVNVHTAIFILFDRRVPDEMLERVFPIYVGKGSFENKISLSIPEPTQFGLIYDQVKACHEINERALKAAIAFLYSSLDDSQYRRLLAAADELIDEACVLTEALDMAALFNSILIDAIESEKVKVTLLPEIKVAEFDDRLFIESAYAYLSENTFRTLFAEEVYIPPIGKIKAELNEAGILPSRIGDYTAKMPYSIGKIKDRKRMMRFDLQLLPEIKSYLY